MSYIPHHQVLSLCFLGALQQYDTTENCKADCCSHAAHSKPSAADSGVRASVRAYSMLSNWAWSHILISMPGNKTDYYSYRSYQSDLLFMTRQDNMQKSCDTEHGKINNNIIQVKTSRIADQKRICPS